METIKPNPWYREPWPWVILGILGLGVTSGLSILTIGLSNPPQIVTGDFALLGKAVVDTHVRTDRARALGLDGEVIMNGDQIALNLKAEDFTVLPEHLLIQFQHPARSELDTTTLLLRQTDGTYTGALAAVPHERARVIVSDPQQTWWLAGRLSANTAGPIAVTTERL